MTNRKHGTVKWFNDAKGFGFITPDEGDEELFAHFSAIQASGFRTLKEGARVSYEEQTGPKGKLALNIQTQDIQIQDTVQPAVADLPPMAAAA